jgi:Fur family ferric uptake transcriptional regulator
VDNQDLKSQWAFNWSALSMDTPEVLERLRAVGHRLTQPRQAVVETVLGQTGQFTATELCVAVASRAPQVGRATVFRTMQLLVDAGILERVHTATGRDVYVVDSRSHHHHFVCGQCGQVTSMEGCGLDEFLDTAADRYGFAVEGHFVEIYGRCRSCTAATPASIP